MWTGRALRMTIAVLWLMATLFVALAPAAARVSGPLESAVSAGHGDCSGMAAVPDTEPAKHPAGPHCGGGLDMLHGAACAVGGVCIGLPTMAVTCEPPLVVDVSTMPWPVVSRMRSGTDPDPGFRPPRLSA